MRTYLRFILLSSILLAVCLFPAGIPSSKAKFPQRKPDKAQRPRHKKKGVGYNFQIGQSLSLKFIKCVGDINFAAVGFRGRTLDIGGGIFSLGGGGKAIEGSLRANALNKTRLDATLTFIFDEGNIRSAAEVIGVPTTLSAHLIQNRKNARRFTLSPVGGGTAAFKSFNLTCASATAVDQPMIAIAENPKDTSNASDNTGITKNEVLTDSQNETLPTNETTPTAENKPAPEPPTNLEPPLPPIEISPRIPNHKNFLAAVTGSRNFKGSSQNINALLGEIKNATVVEAIQTELGDLEKRGLLLSQDTAPQIFSAYFGKGGQKLLLLATYRDKLNGMGLIFDFTRSRKRAVAKLSAPSLLALPAIAEALQNLGFSNEEASAILAPSSQSRVAYGKFEESYKEPDVYTSQSGAVIRMYYENIGKGTGEVNIDVENVRHPKTHKTVFLALESITITYDTK